MIVSAPIFRLIVDQVTFMFNHCTTEQPGSENLKHPEEHQKIQTIAIF